MFFLYLVSMHGGLGLLEICASVGARVYLADLTGRVIAFSSDSRDGAMHRALNATGINPLGYSRGEVREAISNRRMNAWPGVAERLEALAEAELGEYVHAPAPLPTAQPVRFDMPHTPPPIQPQMTPAPAVKVVDGQVVPPPGWPSYLGIPPEAKELASPEHLARVNELPGYLARPPAEEEAIVARKRAEQEAAEARGEHAPTVPPAGSAAAEATTLQPMQIPGHITRDQLPAELRAALDAQEAAGGKIIDTTNDKKESV